MADKGAVRNAEHGGPSAEPLSPPSQREWIGAWQIADVKQINQCSVCINAKSVQRYELEWIMCNDQKAFNVR